MKIFSLILFLLLFFVQTPVWAQTVISVDITKARLVWTWTQGTGGAVTEFRVKCGSTTGIYTKITILTDPTARFVTILSAITGPGNWFCVVSAANQFGESANTNEVSFAAGQQPVGPSGLQIIAL